VPEAPPAAAVLERFAREVLGCRCEPEVFAQIEADAPPVTALPGIRRRIAIGGRLLIYVAEAPAGPGAAAAGIGDWIAAGLAERERRGMSRLRLVVPLRRGTPEAVSAIEDAFAGLVGLDDRVHLHIVSIEALGDI
jgi:hypothetical protein